MYCYLLIIYIFELPCTRTIFITGSFGAIWHKIKMLTRSEAISALNKWGTEKIPHLFVIDFEMKAIQLLRLDVVLPREVSYNFKGISNTMTAPGEIKGMTFRKFPMNFTDYEKAFLKIQKQIAAGNSFLTNLTFSTPIETNLTLRQLYEHSRAPYKILIDGVFVCFSPESFVTIRKGIITTCPMKGTINASLPGAEQLIMESI